MPPSSTARTGFQTIESFRICLDDFGQVLEAEAPSKWLEAQLLVRLASPVRLLRWAVVKVEPLNVENQPGGTLDVEQNDVEPFALAFELNPIQENSPLALSALDLEEKSLVGKSEESFSEENLAEERLDETFEPPLKKLKTNSTSAIGRRFWCEGAYLRRHVSLS